MSRSALKVTPLISPSIYMRSKIWLEARVDPLRRVVKQVLEAVAVLARHGLAWCARREPVRRAFDDNELLVAADRCVIVDFAVPDEVVRAHGGNQRRDRDLGHRAVRRIVARAP